MNWAEVREGGTETFVRALVAEAQSRRVPVRLLSTGAEPFRNGTLEVQPVVRAASSELAFVRALRRQIRSNRIPLDAASVVLANAEHYVWPFLRTRNPVILIAHGAVPPTLRATRGRLKTLAFELALEKRAVRRAARIVAVSRQTADYYRAKYPEIMTRVAEIPMGIALPALPTHRFQDNDQSASSTGPKILFAGRLSQEKGLPLLIAATGRMRKNRTGLQLLVCGDGPMGPWLLTQQRTRPWIRWVGRLPRSKVLDLMSEVDLLAIASSYEGLPTVLLEAVSLGLPVVSTPVGRAPEILTEDLGALGTHDPEGFASAMERALAIDRKATFEASLRVRESLRFDRTAEALFRLAMELASGSSPPPDHGVLAVH
jgi:glycosyltransferase involved in cell wall biosynthesis